MFVMYLILRSQLNVNLLYTYYRYFFTLSTVENLNLMFENLQTFFCFFLIIQKNNNSE